MQRLCWDIIPKYRAQKFELYLCDMPISNININMMIVQVRTVIAHGSGIEAVVYLMQKFNRESGLLCNACLCLMSLVRGEGPACEVGHQTWQDCSSSKSAQASDALRWRSCWNCKHSASSPSRSLIREACCVTCSTSVVPEKSHANLDWQGTAAISRRF